MKYRHISVAIPALDELEELPKLLISLNHQTFSAFSVYVCVNNPEEWTTDSDSTERISYLHNQATIKHLQDHLIPTCKYQLIVIDRSSTGHGWTGKQRGVGWARKVLFDTIAANCDDNELIVSLDADTYVSDKYLESVLYAMNSNPEDTALAAPYYHPLCDDESNNRAMLRYEIYMRHYLINLLESGNPYAFTALGSAMAFPLWAYKRVDGITPLQGGEDFYLMQKFAKTGRLLLTCSETVRPSGRPSLRVPFGTGPAISKGIDSMDTTYPIYPNEGFQAVAETYALFPQLYDNDIETPMSAFLRQQLKTDNIWQPLRKNFKTRELFVHSCHERVDGLRILQFLKTFPLRKVEEEMTLFCKKHRISLPETFSFRTSPIDDINKLRDALFALEQSLRR